VDEVRRHASEAHGVDLSADVALAVVRRVTARDVHRAFNPCPGTAEVWAFYVIPEGAVSSSRRRPPPAQPETD
jgi:hypothetical protein